MGMIGELGLIEGILLGAIRLLVGFPEKRMCKWNR